MAEREQTEKKPFQMTVSREWIEKMAKIEEECGDVSVGVCPPAPSPALSALWGLAGRWLERSDGSAGTVGGIAYGHCATELIGWLLKAGIPRPEEQER